MAIENFNEDVEVIQKLDTLPNQEGGLSAEELKAKFDQAAMAIKNFINNSLLPVVRELEDAKDPSIIYGLDQTLSEPGRAADAKAVGDALAGKVGTKDIIDITHGGTGAANAEDARRNLDAAKTAHTHAVSDMNAGLLPLERGGTGAGTAAQAMENLGVTAALVALGAPHNYLDNSDFRNPVNQRGQTSYIPAVDKTYRIDRWYTNEARTIELLSNGIEIGLSQNGMLGGLSQRLEHFAVGDIVTFAVQDSEGNRYVTTCALTDDVNAWADVGNGVFLRAICLGGDGIFTIGVSGSSKTFVWAALYEGEYTAETLPEYKPKGYGAELAECQRYFWCCPNGGGSYALIGLGTAVSGTKTVQMLVRYPQIMRVYPTLTVNGAFRLVSNDWRHAFTVSNIEVDGNGGSLSGAALVVSTESDLTAGVAYFLSQKNDTTAKLFFSADL